MINVASLVNGGLSPTGFFSSTIPFSSSFLFSGKPEDEKRQLELLRRDRVDYRHWLLRHTQRLLYFSGVDGSLRGCLQGTFERWSKKERGLVNRAEVHFYGGRFRWVGVAHCKSPWCPVCGPILASKRLEEARRAADYLLKKGMTYVFPTLTASHGPDMSLMEQHEAFSAARDLFMKCGEVKKARKKWGWKFSFYCNEITDDDPSNGQDKRTGWHIHRHFVLWLERSWLTEKETEDLRLLLLAGWKKCLARVGLTCSADRGIYMESLQDFLRKRNFEESFDDLPPEEQKKIVDKVCKYVTKSLGFEMTATGRKMGKRNKYGGKRISVWRLLEFAIMGDKRARARWLELFTTFQEKRFTTFRMSPGLRKFCGMEEKEKTDEELMSETEAGQPVIIFGPYQNKGFVKKDFEWDAWKPIAKQGRLSHFCSILEDSSNFDPVSLARALIGAASVGFDIKTEKWLDKSGLDPIWQGCEFAIVAKDKPWPEAEKRLAEEKREDLELKVSAWLDDLTSYEDEINELDQKLWSDIYQNPDVYAAGRVTKRKKEAWDWVLRHDLWDAMCWYLRDLGYLPPERPYNEPPPDRLRQGRLVA